MPDDSEKYKYEYIKIIHALRNRAHSNSSAEKKKGTHDALRANKGYRVLRFLSTDVLNSPECFAYCFYETIKTG